MKATVYFTARRGVWPLIVQCLGRCMYNHVAIEIEGEIYEAMSKGFVKTARVYDWLLNEEKKGARVFAVQVDLPNGWQYRLKDIHKRPYDFISLLLWQLIYQLTGRWFGSKNHPAIKSIYCSEGVAYLMDLPESWKISPGELYSHILEKNAQRTR